MTSGAGLWIVGFERRIAVVFTASAMEVTTLRLPYAGGDRGERPNDRRQRSSRPARETNTPSLATQPRGTSPAPSRAATRVLGLRRLSRQRPQRASQIRSDLDCRIQFDERRLRIPSDRAAAKFADLPRCEASGLVWRPPMCCHGKLKPMRYSALAGCV